MAKTLIVIAGPTAIGKTTLAIKIAQYYQTEIISADSRQFYREMEIGTAKPSVEELIAIKHHFIDSHSITDAYSVGDYEKDALSLISQLFTIHDVLILAGGSGLFINAIINGLDDLPSATMETRQKLNDALENQGISYLQARLKEVDPIYYEEADIYNPQRITRALEVYETTGLPFSQFRKKTRKQRPFNLLQIGLNTNRAQLYENINLRVDQMIEKGLLHEVGELRQFRHLNPLQTVGYTELFDYYDERLTMDEAVAKIKQNTRRFAKRQLTWFAKDKEIKWFEPNEYETVIDYLNSLLNHPELLAQKS